MSRVPIGGISPGEGYCGHCGEPAHKEAHKETYDGGHAPSSSAHLECATRLQLEPPRFCGQCGRRLKVQVSPLAWRASCSRHGTTTS